MFEHSAPHIMPAMNSVSERNKHKVRLFVDAVWNQGQMELVDELVAADYIGRVGSAHPGILGPRGVRQFISSRRDAHPGLYIRIEDQIAEEDRVVTRWQATTSESDGRPASAPTGAVRCCEGISIVRLIAGKQVDSHTQYSDLTSARPTDHRDRIRRVPDACARPTPSNS